MADDSSASRILPEQQHPLLTCVAQIHEALDTVLDEAAGVNPVFAPAAVKATAMSELHAVGARVQGLLLSLLATADDLAAETGARSPAAWLAATTREDYGPAKGLAVLADALDSRYRHVGAALGAGSLSLAKARVITHGLDRLPDGIDGLDGIDAGVRERAEAHLVAIAPLHTPTALRRLAEKVLEVVAPDVYDERQLAALEAEARRAEHATRLRFRRLGGGTTEITALVPDLTAHRLRTYLEAFAAPRRAAAATEGERLPADRALGHALGDLLDALPAQILPLHGGTATTLVITAQWETLRADARSGDGETLDGTLGLTAGQVRRLACHSGLLPAVLGGASEVLDLGRTRRLATPAQRKALAVRDRHCRAHGCTIPADWCEAHHLDPWSSGGSTDLARLLLLCTHHHHRVHDPAYQTIRAATGALTFHRRT